MKPSEKIMRFPSAQKMWAVLCLEFYGVGLHKPVMIWSATFLMKRNQNDVGDSLYQAGQELGGGMEDATFLKQCGVEVDMRWLAEITSQNQPTEVSNYATSLFRIADMLTQTS
jgi:hypothetical protein